MSNPPADRGAQDPLGEGARPREPADERLLALVRSLLEAADPVPAGLVERVRFSVALAGLEGEMAGLEGEVARLADGDAEASQPRELAGGLALARGASEESRTITFDSSDLTIMIRIDSNADGSARLDGWLAPPRRCRVEIALMGGSLEVAADAEGRFAFPVVPRGAVRIVVRPPEPGSAADGRGQAEAKSVITPALVLLAGE
jgi:hypothetical protein